VSPSEDKGLALGLRLIRFERHKATTATPAGLVKTKVFAEFESPPLPAERVYPSHHGRRHVLKTYAKSRAGAWRVAVRWLRQLQKGKLQ
jgi:hypothetical protein